MYGNNFQGSRISLAKLGIERVTCKVEAQLHLEEVLTKIKDLHSREMKLEALVLAEATIDFARTQESIPAKQSLNFLMHCFNLSLSQNRTNNLVKIASAIGEIVEKEESNSSTKNIGYRRIAALSLSQAYCVERRWENAEKVISKELKLQTESPCDSQSLDFAEISLELVLISIRRGDDLQTTQRIFDTIQNQTNSASAKVLNEDISTASFKSAEKLRKLGISIRQEVYQLFASQCYEKALELAIDPSEARKILISFQGLASEAFKNCEHYTKAVYFAAQRSSRLNAQDLVSPRLEYIGKNALFLCSQEDISRLIQENIETLAKGYSLPSQLKTNKVFQAICCAAQGNKDEAKEFLIEAKSMEDPAAPGHVSLQTFLELLQHSALRFRNDKIVEAASELLILLKH